jgi:hypothetical protein
MPKVANCRSYLLGGWKYQFSANSYVPKCSMEVYVTDLDNTLLPVLLSMLVSCIVTDRWSTNWRLASSAHPEPMEENSMMWSFRFHTFFIWHLVYTSYKNQNDCFFFVVYHLEKLFFPSRSGDEFTEVAFFQVELSGCSYIFCSPRVHIARYLSESLK